MPRTARCEAVKAALNSRSAKQHTDTSIVRITRNLFAVNNARIQMRSFSFVVGTVAAKPRLTFFLAVLSSPGADVCSMFDATVGAVTLPELTFALLTAASTEVSLVFFDLATAAGVFVSTGMDIGSLVALGMVAGSAMVIFRPRIAMF